MDGELKRWAGGESTKVANLVTTAQLWDIHPDGRRLYYHAEGDIYRFDLKQMSHSLIVRTPGLWFPSIVAGICPDGSQIVYASRTNTRITVTLEALHGPEQRPLNINDSGSDVLPKDWSQDGQKLLLHDNPEPFGTRAGIYDIATDTINWLDTTEDLIPICFVQVNDQTKILVQNDISPTERTAAVFDRDGTVRDLPIDGTVRYDHTSTDTVRTGPSTVIVPRETWTRPQELVTCELQAEGADPDLLVGAGTDDVDAVAPPRRVTVDDERGPDISGYLFDSGQRPSPVLVKVYSARPSWGNYFRPYLIDLLSEGYSVFMPEYFYTENPLFDENEHEAYATAGAWIASQDWTDADRLGVIGHSHGGYNAVMQLVRNPDLWTAGVASAPVVDLFTHHEQKERSSYIEHELGDPTEHEHQWQEQNPRSHVAALEAPLLLLYGSDDQNVTDVEMGRFRAALRASGFEEGIDYEYCELDHGHSPETYEENVRYWRAISEFLDRRM
ncbi:MAG: prolyl oligopeptidase family serine peptidase [Halobacteriaceae archaeon]